MAKSFREKDPHVVINIEKLVPAIGEDDYSFCSQGFSGNALLDLLSDGKSFCRLEFKGVVFSYTSRVPVEDILSMEYTVFREGLGQVVEFRSSDAAVSWVGAIPSLTRDNPVRHFQIYLANLRTRIEVFAKSVELVS